MDDRTSIILGLLLLGAVVLDLIAIGGVTMTFLGKKGMVLLEFLAFWR